MICSRRTAIAALVARLRFLFASANLALSRPNSAAWLREKPSICERQHRKLVPLSANHVQCGGVVTQPRLTRMYAKPWSVNYTILTFLFAYYYLCLIVRHLSVLCDSVSVPWKPSQLPSMPPGFGTGHSLRDWVDGFGDSSVVVWLKSTRPSVTCRVSFLLHMRLRPFSSMTTSPSAYRVRGTGQGNRCGNPTTRKLATSVVAKSDEVMRDLG